MQILDAKNGGVGAVIHTDDIEQSAISQIYTMLSHSFFREYCAFMPDVHSGKGSTIGFTMKLPQFNLIRIIPNIIGVDINCGMLSMFCDPIDIDPVKALQTLRINIPTGNSVNIIPVDKHILDTMQREANINTISYGMNFNRYFGTNYKIPNSVDFKKLCKKINMNYERFLLSIGTMGGGNHFIEAGIYDLTGELVFTIHSGSRNFGKTLATYHQRKAIDLKNHLKTYHKEKDRILKEEPEPQRQYLINSIKKESVSDESTWLDGKDAFEYLLDMIAAATYAKYNRIAMAKIIEKEFRLKVNTTIETVHNFIDFDDMIIRKGAVAAPKDRTIIIPFNPEYGILVCKGKGNPDWNCSAPHGAGRVGPRSAFKDKEKAEEVKQRIIASGSYMDVVPTDEIPEAYKDPESIVPLLSDTVDILGCIKPLFTMKGK